MRCFNLLLNLNKSHNGEGVELRQVGGGARASNLPEFEDNSNILSPSLIVELFNRVIILLNPDYIFIISRP